MFWTAIINAILALFFAHSQLTAVVNPDAKFIVLKPDATVLEISADKAAVLAADDRFFFFVKNADSAQPIASITKLMTALVFLENNPGWNKIYQISEADKIAGGRLNLFLGEQLTVKDLFYTSLVASDNGATIALVHATGLSEEAFVNKMNEKAQALGLSRTSFQDPIGLSAANVSTAREVALLAQAALNQSEIRAAASSREYNFTTLEGREKKMESTDHLLSGAATGSLQVLGGKTGYTDQAGYCFVGQLKDENGRAVISVVLNSTGKNERFLDSKKAANWVFNNYDWRQ